LLAIIAAGAALAQPAGPRGAATDITGAQLQALIDKNKGAPVSDQQARIVGINGEYNVGVGIVHRAKTAKQSVGGSQHSDITEVYHVISGSGTLVTGGTLANAKDRDPNVEAVRILTGPSREGSEIVGGTSRTLHAGDVVILPPNTPHTFTEITSDEIVYLVVRFDPKKVLPAGYVNK
jgi:mannose-6-phosphate isomerase-like protein (cupin superfamily)